MSLPSATKQLQILSETTARLQKARGEEAGVQVVFDAFEALGLTRYRLARMLKEENVIAVQYARGDYGELPVRNLTYQPRPGGLTAWVIQQKKPLVLNDFADQSPRYVSFRSRETIKSWMSMPIFSEGDTIGVLTVDSTERDAISQKWIPTLQPYLCLLGLLVSRAVPTAPTDPDLTKMISRSRKSRVLVLGKDTGDELKRLLSIRDILPSLGYQGILVKEHPDIPELSNEDKVRTFAGLCRFVLLENSFPAGQIVECKICSTNRIVTAALREEGCGSSFMVTDYFKDFDFMKEFTYTLDGESLVAAVQQGVGWADKKVEERRQYFDSVYPWRVQQKKA